MSAYSLWGPVGISNDPKAMRNISPLLTPQQARDAADEPIDFEQGWRTEFRRNCDLGLRLHRLRARLARRTVLAVVLGFLAAIGWLHIALSFGVGEGWW